jgi:hypothetical protein
MPIVAATDPAPFWRNILTYHFKAGYSALSRFKVAIVSAKQWK